MTDLFNYRRRETSTVHVGSITIGSDSPIRVQSMTTTRSEEHTSELQSQR